MREEITTSTDSTGEDAALVRAFQRGDRAAFDRLVLKHKDKLFNMCYWFLGDYQEANEAAQDTFIKVYRSLNRFRLESAFFTWFYRIAVNTCRNRLESSAYKQRKASVSLNNPGTPNEDHPALQIADETPTPMADLERKERRTLVRKAIDSLPTDQRAVVTLRDIEGLSYDEIAHVTGLNLGTVKSRLARARLDLRNKLRGALENGLSQD
jgi:RNA polymerase sigma-70 factor (ECF subfamily)